VLAPVRSVSLSLPLALLGLALSGPAWGTANAQTSPRVQASEQILPTQLSAQLLLDAGEFASAIVVATEDLGEDGPLLPLLENLRILGDSHLALGQLPASLDAYARARYELHLRAGLHRLTEIPLLLREATVFVQDNDLKRANDRHEYAFTIRLLQPDSSDLIDATIDLAQWYESNRFLSAARDLYRHALDLADELEPTNDLLHARLHGYVAQTYRAQFFPDLEANKHRDWVRLLLRPHGYRWRDIEALTTGPWAIEYYYRTLYALKKSVALLEESDAASDEELRLGLLQLGDWLLLSRKFGRAYDTYAKLEAIGASERIAESAIALEQPELLSINLPRKPVIPSIGHTKGHIELLIAVDRKGKTRRIRTVHIEPSFVDDLPYRKAIRHARFRPAIIDGVATYSENVTVVLDFDSRD